jgi:hypothetical protein
MGFVWFSVLTGTIYLNNINQWNFIVEKRCVFFAVRTDFLLIAYYLDEPQLEKG